MSLYFDITKNFNILDITEAARSYGGVKLLDKDCYIFFEEIAKWFSRILVTSMQKVTKPCLSVQLLFNLDSVHQTFVVECFTKIVKKLFLLKVLSKISDWVLNMPLRRSTRMSTI